MSDLLAKGALTLVNVCKGSTSNIMDFIMIYKSLCVFSFCQSLLAI